MDKNLKQNILQKYQIHCIRVFWMRMKILSPNMRKRFKLWSNQTEIYNYKQMKYKFKYSSDSIFN